MGISGGGTVASYLSFLEGERLAASVISGYAGYWQNSIFAMHHCVCNYLPGMLSSFELPTLLGAIAPLPMLWESGEMDPIYPSSSAREAENAVRACYRNFGKDEDFVADYFNGIHEIHGTLSCEFLLTHLL